MKSRGRKILQKLVLKSMEKKNKHKKFKDVAKFGGIEHLGESEVHGYKHEIESVEAQSKTTLESDIGVGEAAVIRCFTFGLNPEVWKNQPPTTQELFNSHYKGIEMSLFKDGLKVIPEVNPRVSFNKQKSQYNIFVGARPMSGFILNERPQTLSEIAHG